MASCGGSPILTNQEASHRPAHCDEAHGGLLGHHNVEHLRVEGQPVQQPTGGRRVVEGHGSHEHALRRRVVEALRRRDAALQTPVRAQEAEEDAQSAQAEVGFWGCSVCGRAQV